MISCEHCWHGTGVMLCTYPAQHPQYCCKCGGERTIRDSSFDASGHGPFFRSPFPSMITSEPAVLTKTFNTRVEVPND